MSYQRTTTNSRRSRKKCNAKTHACYHYHTIGSCKFGHKCHFRHEEFSELSQFFRQYYHYKLQKKHVHIFQLETYRYLLEDAAFDFAQGEKRCPKKRLAVFKSLTSATTDPEAQRPKSAKKPPKKIHNHQFYGGYRPKLEKQST